ncbi:MAG TPA: hypothetical protein DCO79_07055 [Spirochaeta sp.]|nr:hypothetical protein [Spirochaeta sp.]
MKDYWSKLDNAGKIYPANVNIRNTTLFRIDINLKNRVNPGILQLALDEIMPRFPYFHVKLKRGLFWYYFKKTEEQIMIRKDIYYPCTEWDFKKAGFLFTVKYGTKKIALEFSHSITDGGGGLEFTKSLLLKYYQLRGLTPADTAGIKIPGEDIPPKEYSDDFRQFYDRHIPASKTERDKAFHLDYKLTQRGIYHVTTGCLDFRDIKALAVEKKLNLTALLCVIYLEVFQQIMYERKSRPAPIVINLPVNLRNIFESRTMFNFFVSVTPGIDPRLGFFSEDDLIKHMRSYLSIEIDRRYVGKMIKRNIETENNIFVRIMPLFIKEMILPVIYRLYGERGYTSGISNLGKIVFPAEIEEEIVSVNVIPPPSPGNLVKMIGFSFKEKFYITFGSLTENKTVEMKFFSRLRKLGVPVKIDTVL